MSNMSEFWFQFNIDIDEKGWEFTQTIELDEDTNTEKIVVPHHNNVAATTFIHDFNKVGITTLLSDINCQSSWAMKLMQYKKQNFVSESYFASFEREQ